MQERFNLTSVDASSSTEKGEVVSIFVSENHPLLLMKKVLPWEEIQETMVKRWLIAGKNVTGKGGKTLDIVLWVPLIVLMIIKKLNSRQMEDYLKENVVARVFISMQSAPSQQIRDHSNIDRAYSALGKEGIEAINGLLIKEAVRHGFANPKILSSDTTVQELPIGYPNEPGILGGIAQRCQRAAMQLIKKGEMGLEQIIEKAKTVIRSVKEHHLFAKEKEEKEQKKFFQVS